MRSNRFLTFNSDFGVGASMPFEVEVEHNSLIAQSRSAPLKPYEQNQENCNHSLCIRLTYCSTFFLASRRILFKVTGGCWRDRN